MEFEVKNYRLLLCIRDLAVPGKSSRKLLRKRPNWRFVTASRPAYSNLMTESGAGQSDPAAFSLPIVRRSTRGALCRAIYASFLRSEKAPNFVGNVRRSQARPRKQLQKRFNRDCDAEPVAHVILAFKGI
jgi:hypothetical protein